MSKHIVYGVDVNDFVSRMKSGAELLKNLAPGEDDDVINHAETILFQQALLGDTVAHDALYLLDPEKSERVRMALEVYDTALNAFEEVDPDLARSLPSEATQENVRRLFFALLGKEQEKNAFHFLEHMWQYFSWQKPKEKIPASAFNTLFTELMARERRDDAHSLLKDAEKYIEWNTISRERTTVEAAMEIFSVFLSQGKYALAKRIIETMKPIVDYQEFLSQLEATIERDSKEEDTPQKATVDQEVQEELQNDQNFLEDQKVSSEAEGAAAATVEAKFIPKECTPSMSAPDAPEKKHTKKEEKVSQKDLPSVPSLLASVRISKENEHNPFVLALIKASGVPIPITPLEVEAEVGEFEYSVPSGNSEFPFHFQLPVWDSPDSPIGTIGEINHNLNDILITLVKIDGVRCLRDIPLLVPEFQAKFPRFAAAEYEKKIIPIVIKVKHTLENSRSWQQRQTVVKPSPTKPITDIRKKEPTSFFQKKRKKRVSR